MRIRMAAGVRNSAAQCVGSLPLVTVRHRGIQTGEPSGVSPKNKL